MARLIYVPVVHSIEEMGSAALEYRAAFIARYGEAEWAERTAKFEKIWVGIVKAIEAMRLNLSNVKVYQDSLPICGHERELVKDLAVKGSRNHQLLEKLMQGGATLIGTESLTLLLDEFKLLQSPSRTEAQAAALLEARDKFIAKQIDATLSDGEIGILFIGALHQVAQVLPKRIEVEYLPVRG
jgi:hypothetical protein